LAKGRYLPQFRESRVQVAMEEKKKKEKKKKKFRFSSWERLLLVGLQGRLGRKKEKGGTDSKRGREEPVEVFRGE